VTTPAWPLFDLQLGCRMLVLRPVTEDDLQHRTAAS
jgi:hypothetical protein